MVNTISTLDALQKIPQIRVQNKYLGELFTESRRSSVDRTLITTELKNRRNKVLGEEIYSLDTDTQTGAGLLIQTGKEYRQKSCYKFGEILRLSSIMALLENKIKTFEIFSKNIAIYFHSKYKFEPAIKSFSERDSALRSIIMNSYKNGNEYDQISIEAQKLLKNTESEPEPAKQREFCIQANALIKKYIQQVLATKNEYKKHPFDIGMRMLLTEKSILENKNFFNDLFKKHGIDYTI